MFHKSTCTRLTSRTSRTVRVDEHPARGDVTRVEAERRDLARHGRVAVGEEGAGPRLVLTHTDLDTATVVAPANPEMLQATQPGFIIEQHQRG